MPTIIYGMEQLAQNVTGITVPNSGHWIPEEQPDFLVKALNIFLAVILLQLVNKNYPENNRCCIDLCSGFSISVGTKNLDAKPIFFLSMPEQH
jgi:hypothetical protein